MDIDRLTGRIIGGAIAVHRELGPGLLESSYKACLFHELICLGLRVEREVAVPVVYRSVTLDCGYRMDLVVEELVILEVKVADRFAAVHSAQLLTYMKLSGLKVGLLINFNVPLLKDGIRRYIL